METGTLSTHTLGKRIGRQAKLFMATLLLMSSPILTSQAHAGDQSFDHRLALAVLKNTADEQIGSVLLVQKGNAVFARVQVNGLTPGFHGFHIHSVGKCDPPDFMSAGGHFNPGNQNHGDHAGDFPLLLVNADGTASATFKTDRFTIDQLFDQDGAAVIVHATPDNYANIPQRYLSDNANPPGTRGPDATTLATGDSGPRVACGVLVQRF